MVLLFEKSNAAVVRYIIWLGLASLLFLHLEPQRVSAQGVNMGAETDTDIRDRSSSALSEGLGGVAEDVDGLRSSIDDNAISVRQNNIVSDDNVSSDEELDFQPLQDSVRSSRDNGFRGGASPTNRRQVLDGNLKAQFEAVGRARQPLRDGDLGARITIDNSDEQFENNDGSDRVIREQNEFIEASGGDRLDADAPRGRAGGRDLQSNTTPSNIFDGQSVAEVPLEVTARDIEPNPYEPVGIGVGGFRVFPEVEILGVAKDNVRRSSETQNGDVALELRPSVRVQSNWSRHSLEGDVSAVGTFHKQFSSEDDRELVSNMRGRIDVTRRTNVEVEAGYELTQQSRGTADSPGGAIESPDVSTTRVGATFNHRFNRLSLQLRGASAEEKFDNAALVGGGESDESDQDNREDQMHLRGTYEFSPALSVFSEGLVERRDFENVSNSDGISRNSDVFGLRAGILFDNGSKLYGEVSLGGIRLTPDDKRLSEFDGVTFDANISWRATDLTALSFEASTGIDATTVVGSPGTLSHSANFSVQHQLMEHFILSAGIGLDYVDYQGVRLVERTYRAELGAEYVFSREASLLMGYEYEYFDTNAVDSNFDSTEVSFGVKLRR